MKMQADALEKLEISLLMEAIYRHYGYDFREYASSSIRRRIWHRIGAERLITVSGLQEKVLHDPAAMDRLFADFSINVTEMYRDPSFFASLQERVFPWLWTLPSIRIWHAGCSTGEEVYALAILLHEEGLLRKSRIYGTDMNEAALELAAQGRFPLSRMQRYTRNYLSAGGKKAFSEYYSVQGHSALFHRFLGEHLVFCQHNLVTDQSFNEFHLILCRNVLIYFNEALQRRTLQLFNSSLVTAGFIGLGRKEGIQRLSGNGLFEYVDPQERIYRKLPKAALERG